MVRKLLRNAGLALILLPEPFTTPFGLALLGASYIFAHFNRIDTPASLRSFINMYLKETRIRGGSPSIIQHKLKQKLSDSEWRYRPEKDVSCGIDTGRLMLRFGKDMTIEFAEPATPIRHNMKQRWAGYVWPGAPPDINLTATACHIIDTSHLSVRLLEEACGGSRKPLEKTIIHTLDIDRLSLRCDTASPGVEKAIHHSMKHNLYGYVLPSVPVHAGSAVVHTMNTDRLFSSPVCQGKEFAHAVNSVWLMQHYGKTMPVRSAEAPGPKVHAFNPAKVSLSLGMG